MLLLAIAVMRDVTKECGIEVIEVIVDDELGFVQVKVGYAPSLRHLSFVDARSVASAVRLAGTDHLLSG